MNYANLSNIELAAVLKAVMAELMTRPLLPLSYRKYGPLLSSAAEKNAALEAAGVAHNGVKE